MNFTILQLLHISSFIEKCWCALKCNLNLEVVEDFFNVFQSLIDSNTWNPSPFWGVFDKGEVEVSQNTFRKVNNDLGKQFERSLWLGRYSSAHCLLNKQALALVNSDTHEALKQLHPFEEELTHFSSLLVGNNYWSSNPLTVKEVFYSLKSRKPGSAPGPSGLSYDHLKHAFAFSSVLIEKLCSYFNKVLAGGCDFPSLLKSSTLVALSKPGGGVRPIAVSESITRLFAVCVFNRCKTSCVNYLYQYQWVIGVVDGASSAVSAVQTLLYHHSSNAALMLDFSNAFNSVTRSSILNALNASPLSAVVPYFFTLYRNSSNLLFNKYTVLSSSGVKQGDPLGPLLFCLAVNQIIVKFQEKFSDFKIVGYMDDLTLVGEPTEMEEAMAYFGSLAKEIGLFLNAKKCLIIVRNDSTKLFYEEVEVPSINFNEDAVRLLGSFIGNSSKVQSLLEKQLEIFENELSMVSDFSIPKQILICFLKIMLLLKI
ncbi:hypothetical protein RCL1_001958 [Eukaryota sp. TZLM3-RCL]